MTKFPEWSATLLGFQFVVEPLLVFFNTTGSFMKEVAFLCSHLMFLLVKFVPSGLMK